MKRYALLLAGLLFAAAASAESFRVDVLLFEDRYNPNGAPGEKPADAKVLDAPDALSLDDAEALAAAGITLLPEPDSLLDAQWQSLRNSQRFEPVWRLAWVQQDPPQFNGPTLRIRVGDPIALPDRAPRFFGDFQAQPVQAEQVWPIEGLLNLSLGRYLHLHAQLAWAQTTVDAQTGELRVVQHRLDEKRRMRSGELHHLDSPRFGLLVLATKYEPPAADEPANAPAPAPR